MKKKKTKKQTKKKKKKKKKQYTVQQCGRWLHKSVLTHLISFHELSNYNISGILYRNITENQPETDVQADLSLRWAHMPFCWFCHEAAQML